MRIPRPTWRRLTSSLLLAACAVMAYPNIAHAVAVEFPDPNLDAAIRTAINRPTGPIQDSDLANLTSLSATYSNITNLSGLEYCTALKTLSLYNNNITDISLLETLTNLTDLYLWENNIQSIDALANLTNLRNLFLQKNHVVDIVPLAQNTGLGTGDIINLSDNPINQEGVCSVRGTLQSRGAIVYITGSCGTPIVYIPDENLELCLREALNLPRPWILFEQALASLTELSAPGAGIRDLTGLSFCTNLQTLDLSYNEISDISALSGLSHLSDLCLGGNDISNLTPLSGLTGLVWLELHENNISSLSGLGTLGGLRYLLLHNNNITSISTLASLANLNYLTLNGNNISNIQPLSGFGAIIYLQLGDNQISNISSLANLTSLWRLGLGKNLISNTAPLAGLTSLFELDLSHNALTSIDPLLSLRSLSELQLGYNQISNISVLAALTNLNTLGLRHNRISDIGPLVANTGLGSSSMPWDQVDVRDNLLSQENLCQDIPTLLNRNVEVYFDGICDLYGQTYTLTTAVSPSGYGTIDPPEGTRRFSVGTEIHLEAEPEAGYVFVRWDGDLTGTENPTVITLESDMRVTAVFSEPIVSYTLTVATEGQGTVEPGAGTHSYASGEDVAVVATPADGWAFDYWEGDATGTANEISILMDGDKSITAVFRELGPYYNLLTAVIGNGTITPTEGISHRYLVDTAVSVSATPDLGWVLDHWEDALTGNTSPNTVVMTEDKQVTAVFVPDGFDYTLSINVDGDGTTSPSAGTHRAMSGEPLTIVATPNPGYVFDHWTGDLSGEANPATIIMNGNKSVRAVFVATSVIHTLTVSADEGGTVTPPDGVYYYADGKKVTLQATADTGYAFDHWEGDVGGSGNPVTITMNADMEVAAVFATSPYIADIFPATGVTTGGDSVTITGEHLAGTTAVSFGGVLATGISAEEDSVTVVSPEHAPGTVDVVLTCGSKTVTHPRAFTYVTPPPPPVFGELSPQRGTMSGGDVITIRGYNLALVTSVEFGGVPGSILSTQATRVVVLAPSVANSGPVDVKITSSVGFTTKPNAFSYYPVPTIDSISPAFGYAAGGDMIVISGTGFDEMDAPRFGNAEAAAFTMISDGQVEVLTPPHDAGLVAVTVTTPGGMAVFPGGFRFYEGDGSIACTVVDGQTNEPIVDATVRLNPLGLTVTDSADGVYLFEGLLPGTYSIQVSSFQCQPDSGPVTLTDGQAYETTFELYCPVTPNDATPCGIDIKNLDTAISEPTMPLSIEHDPGATVPATGTLAIRLTSPQSIAPETVWAQVDTDTETFSGGTWVSVAENDTDGWVTYMPDTPLPEGTIVTMTVGAKNVDGTPVGPISTDFAIGTDAEELQSAPLLVEEGLELPDVLAAPMSDTYRINPPGVYAQPHVVRLRVPEGCAPEDLDLYYFSECAEHEGWYPAENVVGWLVPESRRNVQMDGAEYIEIEVNHSGIVQLGKGIKLMLGNTASIEVGIAGRPALWVSLISVVLALSFMLGRIVRRKPRQAR